MKGLEIARRFFHEWGLPYLRRNHPRLCDRVAAVVCGGSQSLGNDDELSVGHGWGPGLDLILTTEDYKHLGRRLRRSIRDAAPEEWLGYRWGHAPKAEIEVHSINQFFRSQVGCANPPADPLAWIDRANEPGLYMLRHATILHDPLGEFSSRRAQFSHYPRAAWRRRVYLETYNVWHYGQYNFLNRLIQRNDPVAISICLGHFSQATMTLALLLNDDYAPYWKWLAAEFRKQPDAGRLGAWLVELSKCSDLDQQANLVGVICREIYARLVARGLVSPNPKGHPHPLYCALVELDR